MSRRVKVWADLIIPQEPLSEPMLTRITDAYDMLHYGEMSLPTSP